MVHYNDKECIRACNENIFLIENFYSTVFPENEFKSIEDYLSPEDTISHTKIHKIKYVINLLPTLSRHFEKDECIYTKNIRYNLVNPDVNLLEMCVSSDEMDMYETNSLKQYINFKWKRYA